jgi:hypothetical protein
MEDLPAESFELRQDLFGPCVDVSTAALESDLSKLDRMVFELYKEAVARALLEPTERVLREMNQRQRFHFIRALRYRLRSIAALNELRSL